MAYRTKNKNHHYNNQRKFEIFLFHKKVADVLLQQSLYLYGQQNFLILNS